jgi:hypothetical protein
MVALLVSLQLALAVVVVNHLSLQNALQMKKTSRTFS